MLEAYAIGVPFPLSTRADFHLEGEYYAWIHNVRATGASIPNALSNPHRAYYFAGWIQQYSEFLVSFLGFLLFLAAY